MEHGVRSELAPRYSTLPAPCSVLLHADQCHLPGCMKRFSVADKFAGQKGPCPKCKKTITIPKKEDEVVIHAPEHSEAGAVGAGGRHALKTYKRKDTKFQPLVFTAVVGFVLVALLIALVLRSAGGMRSWLKALAAVRARPAAGLGRLHVSCATRSSKRITAVNLAIRSLACGLVLRPAVGRVLVSGRAFFGADAFSKGWKSGRWSCCIVPVFAAGTLAAYASFDLDPGSASSTAPCTLPLLCCCGSWPACRRFRGWAACRTHRW